MKSSLGISNFLEEISSLSHLLFSSIERHCSKTNKKKKKQKNKNKTKQKKSPYQILLLIHNAPGHPKVLVQMYEISVTFMCANIISILGASGSRSIFTFQVLFFKKYTL